jgi:predicted nucleic acid-binding protein
MKVILDTNCLIDAVNPSSHAYRYVQKILASAKSGKITLAVSRHTLAEVLEPVEARALAGSLATIPYWPVGTIAEQVSTIEQLTGTWDDSKRNQEIEEEVARLAKSGTDIRDRGAYLDALRAEADVFVTSDKQLAGSGPASRIRTRFGLRICTPFKLASEIDP